MEDAERINLLRSRCLARKAHTVPWVGDARLVARSLQASEDLTSWTERRGQLTRDLLAWTPLEMDHLELLAGRLAQDCPAWIEERQQAQAYLQEHAPHVFTPGQSGHCQLDFSRLFELGLDGLRSDILQRANAASGKPLEVYRSFDAALEGLALLIEHAGDTAEAAAACAAGPAAGTLDAVAAACRRVAHLPPRTFFEALQLTWLAILGVQLADHAYLVNPGHLDRTLAPYYQADLDAGRITPEGALVLIESLYLLLNENIPDGLAISIMVGGRDAQGQDITNPLSYLCLEALRRTRLVYPTVGVCWHEGAPLALTDLAVDLMTRGLPNPAFFGDETIQRGLQMYGVPPEEAWDYVNSTCVEITPVGASNVWVASPYFSTCQILLDEIAAQVEGAAPAPTFDDFLTGYRWRLAMEIGAAVAVENQNRQVRQQYGGKPLQSVFTRDCVTRGQDIDDGGARYNWVECSFVGLANLADSLQVIRAAVYEEKRFSLADLERMLKANFAGYEMERQRFLNRYPKYGNDCALVDDLVGKIVTFAREECARYGMQPDSSPFVPGAFCWVMHERLGSACGATPDGRRAGAPFADGCGAAQGREKAGPTAAVLSVTSWDAAPLIGGAAFNLKFPSALFKSPGAADRLRDLLVTFLARGGFETQVNVVDASVLKAAQADPESYRDLVVRIGGYTDYFTRLSPEMQAEVILRTEYEGI